MKKLISLTFVLLFALSMIPGRVEAKVKISNCAGYTTVSSSWWGPSNDTYYSMCGCQSVKGYSASGACN